MLDCNFHIDLETLVACGKSDEFWKLYLERTIKDASATGIHLAIFAEPFLSLVLAGKKSIESRFSDVRCAPYGAVMSGDVILIKGVSGPICGLALAKRAWFYSLTHEPINRIREQHGASICGDDQFWLASRDASYATLIELEHATRVQPIECDKRDRRGWVSMRSRQLTLFR